MAVRRRLIVSGRVQAVGYRAYVKMVARNMGIKGSVKNLDDGTVEVYCECPDETAFEGFKRGIDRKAHDPKDPMQIHVSAIEEYDDSWEGFDESRIRYPFDVIYDGMELSPLEKESLERSEMAILAMTFMNENLGSKMDSMHQDLGQKIDSMHQDLGSKQDHTLEAIKDMHQDLGSKQDKMLDKQDKTIAILEDMNDNIQGRFDNLDDGVSNLTSTVNNKFDWLAERYGEFGRTMQELKDDIHEMKETFVRFTDYITNKESSRK